MDKITKSDQYPPNINALWDVRDQDFSNVTPGTIQSLVNISRQYPERGTAWAAFIVEKDLAFGMLRMYEITSSMADSDSSQNLRVFRSYNEAEKWLLGEES